MDTSFYVGMFITVGCLIATIGILSYYIHKQSSKKMCCQPSRADASPSVQANCSAQTCSKTCAKAPQCSWKPCGAKASLPPPVIPDKILRAAASRNFGNESPRDTTLRLLKNPPADEVAPGIAMSTAAVRAAKSADVMVGQKTFSLLRELPPGNKQQAELELRQGLRTIAASPEARAASSLALLSPRRQKMLQTQSVKDFAKRRMKLRRLQKRRMKFIEAEEASLPQASPGTF